jgi:hypothetical protein
MSAGFDLDGEVYWGTNGAVEAYLGALARIAADRFGPDDALAAALRRHREGFFTGMVVDLDESLGRPGDRRRFASLLDAATAELLRGDAFSDLGRTWATTRIGAMRDRLAATDPRE